MISFTYILYDQEKKIDIESLNGYDLSNLHLHRLSHNDKYQYSFCDTHSIYANFFKTTFRSVNFIHSIFEQCYFNESNFFATSSNRTIFKKSSFNYAYFADGSRDSTFSECGFFGSYFGANFLRFWFIDNIFDGCYFKNTKFENCLFGDCIFKNCTFENCEFIDCNIYENIDTNNQFIKCENPFIKVES